MILVPSQAALDTVENYCRNVSTLAPHKKTLPESTNSMVDSLAHNIRRSDGSAAGEELAALIDIATYRNTEADTASRRAEQHLLTLYARPETSAAVRRQIIDQLFESEAILAQGTGANAKEFAMPASLKHLMAQYVHSQIAAGEGDLATDPVHLEEIEWRLEEASGLNEQLADSSRYVTTDEVLATFSNLPAACPHVINLSSDVEAEAAQMQMGMLLERVPETGVVMAPLLVDSHFMLVVAEKSAAPGKFALTIGNTYLPISQAAIKAVSGLPAFGGMDGDFIPRLNDAAAGRFSEQLFKKISPAFAGKVAELNVVSNHLQAHALNSCGPLVSMLAETLSRHGIQDRQAGALIQELSDEWRGTKPEQQKNAVIAHRAKMLGHMIEWRRASSPGQGRFMDSRPFARRQKPENPEKPENPKTAV